MSQKMASTIKSKTRKDSLQSIFHFVMGETILAYLLFFLVFFALSTTARQLPEVNDNTIGKLHKLTFKRHPSPLMYGEPGKRLKLTCRVRGHGDLAVTWYKDNEKIVSVKSNNSSRIRVMRNALIFHLYEEDDAGNYSCAAETKRGQRARVDFTLLTQDDFSSSLKQGDNPSEATEKRPQWMRKYRENVYYPAGTLVKLRCHSEGNPPPHVIWKKDGKKKAEGSTLVIRKLLSRHKGEYVCIAENRVGKISHKYNLNVIEVNSMSPPKIEGLKNQTVQEGATAVFKCSVDNHKAPFIEWSRSKWPNTTEQQGGETDESESTEKISVAKKLTNDKYRLYLVIKNVSMEDTGIYTCKAVNIYGKSHKSAWLSLKSEHEIFDKSRLADDLMGLTSGSTWKFSSKNFLNNKSMQKLIFPLLYLSFLFLSVT